MHDSPVRKIKHLQCVTSTTEGPTTILVVLFPRRSRYLSASLTKVQDGTKKADELPALLCQLLTRVGETDVSGADVTEDLLLLVRVIQVVFLRSFCKQDSLFNSDSGNGNVVFLNSKLVGRAGLDNDHSVKPRKETDKPSYN